MVGASISKSVCALIHVASLLVTCPNNWENVFRTKNEFLTGPLTLVTPSFASALFWREAASATFPLTLERA